MNLLRLIGVLMDYPRDELWQYRSELLDAVQRVPLAATRRDALADFIGALVDCDQLDMQTRWLTVFDRGRAMSLLLFEHIHGQSRDRGQAMVDLLETYQCNGFELSARELPDYLPLVLEYLAFRPDSEAREWLFHVRHILALLAARAAERDSAYALLFEILTELADGTDGLPLMRQRARDEPRDDTQEAMDRVWEEEAVRFGGEIGPESMAASGTGEEIAPTTRQSTLCEVSS